MDYPLFFGLVGLLTLIYIWIGKRASKGLKTGDDYYLMGRELSFLPLFLTLLATQVGGGTLLGAAQEAYDKGWLVLFYPLGMSLGFLLLGLGFGGKLRRLEISTMAEIFERVYGSAAQRKIASGLSIAALFLILVAQGIALKLFFGSIGANAPLLFFLVWSVLVGYTVMGGLKAVVNTDVLQALFILGVLAIAFFSVDLSGVSFENAGEINTSWSGIPWTSWLFMPLLFMLIEQDMGQRCFAAKNPRVISYAAIASAAALFCSSFVAIYFGVMAKKLGIEAAEKGSIFIEAVNRLTNPFVGTLFMVAILLAVISTADSLLSAISSNLFCDFLGSQRFTEKRKVRLSKLMTFATGLLAIGFASLFDQVVMMLILSYELSVSVLFIPIVFAVLAKRPSKRGASVSMAFGAVGFFLFRAIPAPLPGEVLTVLLSLAGYWGGKKIEETAPKMWEVEG